MGLGRAVTTRTLYDGDSGRVAWGFPLAGVRYVTCASSRPAHTALGMQQRGALQRGQPPHCSWECCTPRPIQQRLYNRNDVFSLAFHAASPHAACVVLFPAGLCTCAAGRGGGPVQAAGAHVRGHAAVQRGAALPARPHAGARHAARARLVRRYSTHGGGGLGARANRCSVGSVRAARSSHACRRCFPFLPLVAALAARAVAQSRRSSLPHTPAQAH